MQWRGNLLSEALTIADSHSLRSWELGPKTPNYFGILWRIQIEIVIEHKAFG